MPFAVYLRPRNVKLNLSNKRNRDTILGGLYDMAFTMEALYFTVLCLDLNPRTAALVAPQTDYM